MRSVAEHLDQPTLGTPPEHVLAGVSDPAIVDGCAGGSCGVLANYWLDVDEHGVIRECTARVRGRASAFATASALCEAARGRSVIDAAKLGLSTMHPTFAQFDAEDQERALVAEDGFHHAIGRWLLARMREAPAGTGARRPALAAVMPEDDRPGAIVGMSGGVDSGVALHRMLDTYDGRAVGATLRLWIDPRAPDPEAACCSPDSVRRARTTCHAAGVAHLSIDLREAFARDVVVPFVTEYATGATPNPCVRCNGRFRLDELVRLADVVGADVVATGHYARIVERSGVSLIARGVDAGKDQSYMLADVEPATVARLRFPLGEQHKPQTRAQAAALGLEQADTPESQEVCFLGGGDYRDFLARAGAMGAPGEIVLQPGDEAVVPHARANDDGEIVVGTHAGIASYTPGQRRGVGIAATKPLYVLDVDGASGRVTVGSDASHLDSARIALSELRWHDPEQPARVHVQPRYRARHGATPATVHAAGETDAANGAVAILELDHAQRAGAAGQAAVLYDEYDVVVGCGRIMRTAPLSSARTTQ
jgi:tRNA-specific 2-thiouridylase